MEPAEKAGSGEITIAISRSFEQVGQLTERNALAMHATTRTATPAFSYLTEESHKAMDFVRELRAAGHACYFTMDAPREPDTPKNLDLF